MNEALKAYENLLSHSILTGTILQDDVLRNISAIAPIKLDYSWYLEQLNINRNLAMTALNSNDPLAVKFICIPNVIPEVSVSTVEIRKILKDYFRSCSNEEDARLMVSVRLLISFHLGDDVQREIVQEVNLEP